MTNFTPPLLNKTILITGAARGIGRATALLCAAHGAQVAAADLDLDGARATADAITSVGSNAIALRCDVSVRGDVDAMVATTLAAFGRLDGAFNNAGIAAVHVGVRGAKTAEWPEEAVDRMLAVNLKGVWLAMRAELEVMVAQGAGAIVNTGSIAGVAGLQTASAYAAAKHGVVGFTRTAAIEYAEAGIRVNAVCPGYIETDMTREVMKRRGTDILTATPMRRMGQPEEIANAVAWLLSDAASYVTGAAYSVDGGYTAA
ncbi:MAG: SDR family NAD(P)-dependent oxidoreductase [Hyphomicrobiaceae bacterium]